MMQPARLFVVAIALVTVASISPSSSSAQNTNRRNHRNAIIASRPYVPVGMNTGVNRAPANPADVQAVTQAYRLLVAGRPRLPGTPHQGDAPPASGRSGPRRQLERRWQEQGTAGNLGRAAPAGANHAPGDERQ